MIVEMMGTINIYANCSYEFAVCGRRGIVGAGESWATDLELSAEDIGYLEEPYVPHPLAGVMAQNKRANAGEKHVWTTGDEKIGRK